MKKRKFAEGGEVDNSDRLEEQGPRGLYYNKLLNARRYWKDRERRADRDELTMSESMQPGEAFGETFYLNTKRTPQAQARVAAAQETRRRRNVATAQENQRIYEHALDTEGTRIGQRRDPTRVEDNGYKAGGWIKGAIKKPGALRAQMGVKAGQKIPAKKLATAAKAPGKLGQRARLAQTLSKMKKK